MDSKNKSIVNKFNFSKVLSIIKSEFKLQSRRLNFLIAFLCISTIVSSFLNVMASSLTKNIISCFKGGSKDEVIKGVLQFTLVLITSMIITNFSKLIIVPKMKEMIRKNAINQIRTVFSLPYKEFHSKGLGEHTMNIKRSSLALNEMVELFCVRILSVFCTILFSVFFLAFAASFFVSASFVAMTATFIGFTVHYTLLRLKYQEMIASTENEISNKLTERIKNRDTIVVMKKTEEEIQKINEIFKKNEASRVKFARSLYVINICQEVIFRLYQFMVIFINVHHFTRPDFDYQGFVSVFVLVSGLWGQLFITGWIVQLVLKNSAEILTGYESKQRLEVIGHESNITDISNITDESNLTDVSKQQIVPTISLAEKIQKIEFKDLSVNLEGRLIFGDFNLILDHPCSVAIVGPNGAGKSVFIKALLKFHEFGGEVKFNGRSTREIDIYDRISYATQDAELFEDTLMGNLRFGNSASDKEIIETCEEFGFSKDLAKLGFYKNIGYLGKRLSGGEKQKIIIIRNVSRDSDIFIFDETTSAMDKKSEGNAIHHILEKKRGTFMFFIIHDLSFLKYFDKVLFLKNKDEREFGSDEELKLKSKSYSNFISKAQKSLKNNK